MTVFLKSTVPQVKPQNGLTRLMMEINPVRVIMILVALVVIHQISYNSIEYATPRVLASEDKTITSGEASSIKSTLNADQISRITAWHDATKSRQSIIEVTNGYLNNNCAPELKDMGEFFYAMGTQYNRHPFAVLSIITADSSCGRNLTTPFNYGNVGNTDSCATCQSYSGAEKGIEAVFHVLTNDYLKNATKLCHLSRGGWNSCPEGRTINAGKLYASSVVNWQVNTNSIMSILTGVDNAGNTQSILFK